MSRLQGRASAEKGKFSFVAMLYLTIVTALLCALAPIGPPASRDTGSAFNPATTAVLLKARSPVAPEIARAERPDGDMRPAPPAAFVLLLFAGVLALALYRRLHMGGMWVRGPALLRSAPCSTRHARAPPVLS